MKTINKISILLLMISIVSCSSFLDEEQENVEDFTQGWRINYLERKVAELYAPYQRMYDRGYFFFIAASDDMVTGRTDNASAKAIKDFTLTGDESYINQGWSRRYGAIETANEIISNIDKVENLSKENKDRYLGEAYFTLGFMYFELAYHYANNIDGQGIPIIDPNNTEGKATPRANSIIDNFKFIEKSLLKAIDLLPYFNAAKFKDHAHKTVALAYLSKTYLYWAQYDKSKYAKAVETADKIINSGRHALLPNFKDVFTVSENYGSEYIWSVPSVAVLDEGSILPGAMFENQGWRGTGLPNVPNNGNGYNGWGYFQPTKELYDAYVEGDKRRDITLFKEEDQFTYFGNPFIWKKTSKNFTGLMFAKYIEPFADQKKVSTNKDHPCTDLNVSLIRYAEVLLIKAEALIADGKNGDVPLNKIRNRAGLSTISGATMNDLKRERRCELAGEFADRHFDLVRWGDAETVYKNPLHGMIADKEGVNGKAKRDAKGNILFKTVQVWEGRTFDPQKHNVWPIPPSEISKSGKVLKQNKGY